MNNIHWQAPENNQQIRAVLKDQLPSCIGFASLADSGKSIAILIEKHLNGQGRHTYLLDGGNVGYDLNRILGFIEADLLKKFDAWQWLLS